VEGPEDDGGICVRRPLSRIRETGSCSPAGWDHRGIPRNPRSVQGSGPRRAVLNGCGVVGGPHRTVPVRRTGTLWLAPRDLPDVLALVGCRGRLRTPAWQALHRLWLDASHRREGEPADATELPHAGERSGNVAPRLLAGDRAWCESGGAGSRCPTDRGAA